MFLPWPSWPLDVQEKEAAKPPSRVQLLSKTRVNSLLTPVLVRMGTTTPHAQHVADGPTTTIAFNEYEFDFGTLTQGDAVTHMFEFTNSGDEPLIIDNCKGSCGCTVPKCPKEPIQPGEKGQIEVKFNSKGKKNQQTKKGHHQCQYRSGSDVLDHQGVCRI